MLQVIIKEAPMEDFYAVFNTVLGTPVLWGSRAYLEEHYQHAEAERFTRADLHGSSLITRQYGWHDDTVYMREVPEIASWAPRGF